MAHGRMAVAHIGINRAWSGHIVCWCDGGVRSIDGIGLGTRCYCREGTGHRSIQLVLWVEHAARFCRPWVGHGAIREMRILEARRIPVLAPGVGTDFAEIGEHPGSRGHGDMGRMAANAGGLGVRPGAASDLAGVGGAEGAGDAIQHAGFQEALNRDRMNGDACDGVATAGLGVEVGGDRRIGASADGIAGAGCVGLGCRGEVTRA